MADDQVLVQGVEYCLFFNDQYPLDRVDRWWRPADGLHLTIRDRGRGEETLGARSLFKSGQISVTATIGSSYYREILPRDLTSMRNVINETVDYWLLSEEVWIAVVDVPGW